VLEQKEPDHKPFKYTERSDRLPLDNEFSVYRILENLRTCELTKAPDGNEAVVVVVVYLAF